MQAILRVLSISFLRKLSTKLQNPEENCIEQLQGLRGYMVQHWACKGHHIDQMTRTEKRILRWTCGKTRGGRIRNENIMNR